MRSVIAPACTRPTANSISARGVRGLPAKGGTQSVDPSKGVSMARKTPGNRRPPTMTGAGRPSPPDERTAGANPPYGALHGKLAYRRGVRKSKGGFDCIGRRDPSPPPLAGVEAIPGPTSRPQG